MKTIILFVIFAAVLFTTSCKKSYTCECTTNTVVTPNIPGYPKTTFTVPSQTTTKAYSAKMTNSQATAACDHEKETLESTEKAALDAQFAPYGALIKYSFSTTCFIQ